MPTSFGRRAHFKAFPARHAANHSANSRWAFHGSPQVQLIRVECCSEHMPEKEGKGIQKKARNERLKKEIVEYVQTNEPCTAQQIVAWLTIHRKMRNHGLPPPKVGFFIPRHCKSIEYYRDHAAGRRVYVMAED